MTLRIRYASPATLLATLAILASLAPNAIGADDQLAPVPDFERDIRPLLAAHCLDCHGQETQEQGLSLATVSAMLQGGESGPAIVRGDPRVSLLISMIESGEMPPDQEEPLDPIELAKLRQWIAAGSPSDERILDPRARRILVSDADRAHWAFEKPDKPAVPELNDNARLRTPIDHFVLDKLQAEGLTFSPEASRLSLLRRAYFDLLGLPPPPEEVAAFLADEDPDSYEHLIDRLLRSRHYGERWARLWLDLVGYSDTAAIDNDLDTVVPNEEIWRYRDWVIRALNADMPYDRFLAMQLAGDELIDWRNAPTYTPEVKDHLIATGYFRHTQDVTNHDQYGRKERFDVLAMAMESFTSGVLGMTFACAQCHDHKYEPLPQRDYYRLMGVLMSAYNPDEWVKPKDRFLADVPQSERQAIDRRNAEIQTEIDRLGKELKAAQESSEGGDASSKQDNPTVAQLEAQIEQLKPKLQSYGKIQALWDVGPPPDTYLLRRGIHDQRGARLQPGFPAVLSDDSELVNAQRPSQACGETSGLRLDLAQWLTRPGTRPAGLVARVLVNHVWRHHFGSGIVATPGNLGRSGTPPTHPDMLNWLAADFIESGWNMKRLHRQIMLSTVYRQASLVVSNPKLSIRDAQTIDPSNRLLWRAPIRRLDAESVRDAILAVSGKLNRKAGGPPVMLESQPDGMSKVKPDSSADESRRSIYVFVRRNYPLKFLEIFDTPIVPLNCTQRAQSATVLQSLALLNDPFLLEHAGHASRRLNASVDLADSRQAVTAAYVLIVGRPPAQAELKRCQEYFAGQIKVYDEAPPDGPRQAPQSLAMADLCHMLMCSNSFLYLE